MRHRHIAFLGATLFALWLCVPSTGHAQSPAQAYALHQSAQTLAKQSLDCLNRGEEATDSAQQLAAYREGLRYAEAAVEADDDCADAHYAVFANRGRLMMLQGAIANPFNVYVVQRELNRTLELDPAHVDGLAAKGIMLHKIPRFLGGSSEGAITYLKQALALDPNAVDAHRELAKIYEELGQSDLGVTHLEQAAEIATRNDKPRLLEEIRVDLQKLQGR